MDFAADLAKQWRKISSGGFEVSKNVFCVYSFCWCVFPFVLNDHSIGGMIGVLLSTTQRHLCYGPMAGASPVAEETQAGKERRRTQGRLKCLLRVPRVCDAPWPQ